MFGHHRRKREKRRAKEARTLFEQEKKDFAEQAPAREKELADYKKSQVAENVEQSKQQRQQGRQEGRAYFQDVMNQEQKGLDPAARSALQYEANQGIQRGMQSANRSLLGQQSERGIMGKSGVAHAQRRDLQRMGLDAERGVTRDLTKLDSDMKLKQLAAMINLEQGEAAQTNLDRQMAVDELDLAEERKRLRKDIDNFNRQFTRA